MVLINAVDQFLFHLLLNLYDLITDQGYFTMKVDVYVGGLGATLSARILPLAHALVTLGVECRLITPINWKRLVKGKVGDILPIFLTHFPQKYIRTLSNPPDVVIIGRVSTPQMFLLQKAFQHKGSKVIFDLDDSLFLPEGRLLGVNFRPGSFCLEDLIKNADFVTVNGHYLLNYVNSFNRKAAIIHDPVDVHLFQPQFRRTHDKIVIGWQGNPFSHHDNLRILVDPLAKIAQEYDVKFKIVSYLGDLEIKQMFKRLEDFIEVDYGLRKWVPNFQFAKLLYDFDILLAPLKKNSWYQGKSSLRVGTGMALGIPVIASPVGEQKFMIKHAVNGFLASGKDDWYHYLKILVENPKLRQIVGQNGRKSAESQLSLGEASKKLHNILSALAPKSSLN